MWLLAVNIQQIMVHNPIHPHMTYLRQAVSQLRSRICVHLLQIPVTLSAKMTCATRAVYTFNPAKLQNEIYLAGAENTPYFLDGETKISHTESVIKIKKTGNLGKSDLE